MPQLQSRGLARMIDRSDENLSNKIDGMRKVLPRSLWMHPLYLVRLYGDNAISTPTLDYEDQFDSIARVYWSMRLL